MRKQEEIDVTPELREYCQLLVAAIDQDPKALPDSYKTGSPEGDLKVVDSYAGGARSTSGDGFQNDSFCGDWDYEEVGYRFGTWSHNDQESGEKGFDLTLRVPDVRRVAAGQLEKVTIDLKPPAGFIDPDFL